MSASYYDQCPRCKKRGAAELEAAYGEVPEVEYMEMKERHEDYDFYNTVRVDRTTSATLKDDGTLVLGVSYRYECGRCGLEGYMNTEEEFPDQDKPRWANRDASNFYQLDMDVTFHP